MNNKEKYKAQLERKKERLDLYYKQEEKIMTGGVQAYGIGSRSLTRYNTDLAQVRDTISKLEEEIEELEGLLSGNTPRKCRAIIPRF